MKSTSLRPIALAGMIAVYYVVISYLLQPFTYGVLQFRIAEVLTVLPIIFPEAIWGLGIGCFLVNLSSPFGVFDLVFGTFATVLAAYLTYQFRKRWALALLMPVLINGIIVGFYVSALSALPFWSTAFYISFSQGVIVFLLGIPFLTLLRKFLIQGF